MFRRRSLHGLLQSHSGYALSDKEARSYLRWCLQAGYSSLYDAPDFDEIRHCL